MTIKFTDTISSQWTSNMQHIAYFYGLCLDDILDQIELDDRCLEDLRREKHTKYKDRKGLIHSIVLEEIRAL